MGENTIAIFFKDCGYESNVHDNQCLWFEQVCGKYHFKKGELRQSLKQFLHVMGHVSMMIEDQYDYYAYSMRKFTLVALEQFLKL